MAHYLPLLALFLSSCLLPHYVEVSFTRGGVDVDGQARGPGGRYVLDWEDPYHEGTITAGWYLRPVPVRRED